MNRDLQADLDILSYCFADQIRAKIGKRPPSKELQKRMAEILPKIREQLADDEMVSFSMEVCKDSYKEGKEINFANIKAIIVKKDE